MLLRPFAGRKGNSGQRVERTGKPCGSAVAPTRRRLGRPVDVARESLVQGSGVLTSRAQRMMLVAVHARLENLGRSS